VNPKSGAGETTSGASWVFTVATTTLSPSSFLYRIAKT